MLGWNFERRRDTCARFLIGVSQLANALAGRETSLEKVRSRMKLSPEEALFAARRLHEEELLTFDPGGAVCSNGRGIERAAALVAAVRASVARYDETARLLAAGGTPLAVVAAVIRTDGGALVCGAPASDEGTEYRLVLVADEVVLERRASDGAFVPAS